MSGPQWSANCGESPPPPGYLHRVHMLIVCPYIHALGYSRHWRISQPSGEEGISNAFMKLIIVLVLF